MMRINKMRLRIVQKGLTLVELMVAMALAVFVVLLASMTLTGAAMGLRTTDASAQLVDTSIRVSTLLQRSVSQAGYQPSSVAKFTREAHYTIFGGLPYPDVYGRRNAQMVTNSSGVSAENVTGFYTGGGSGGGLATSTGLRGNDLLAIRFQALPENNEGKEGVTALADLCTGDTLTTDAYNKMSTADKAEMHKPIYTFFVGPDPKDNTGGILYCKSWVGASATTDAVTTPVADGVVAFKVLYGVFKDGSAGAPTEWKAADKMLATEWQKVTRIRVGLLLQSRPGAGPAHNGNAFFYPLGIEFANNAQNTGSKIEVSYNNGHLYRVMNFTINVQNKLQPRNKK